MKLNRSQRIQGPYFNESLKKKAMVRRSTKVGNSQSRASLQAGARKWKTERKRDHSRNLPLPGADIPKDIN